ncbi:MAG: DUF5808 domain-containing protein [Balneolaceae bacterium]
MELLTVLLFLSVLVILILIQARAEWQWRQEHRGESLIEEKGHYYGPGIYFNPSDKRILVDKSGGGGRTFNFGNPIGIVLFLLFVAAALYLLFR